MSNQNDSNTCNHEWIEDFDPVEDAAAYNNGFNYFPTYQVCTKCGKKKKIRHETWPGGGCTLSFLVILDSVLVVKVLLLFM